MNVQWKAFLAVLVLVVLCHSETTETVWLPCSPLTNAIKDTYSRKLIQDYDSINRAIIEKQIGLSQGDLSHKETDSKIQKIIKDYVSRNHIKGRRLQNGLSVANVPSSLTTVCTTRKISYYNGTDIPYINHFSKQYKSDQSKLRLGAIFLLQGGPGLGGEALEVMGIKLWNDMGGQYDIVIPDHRGTARSTMVTCTETEPEKFPTCQKSALNNLDGFTTDQAAMDTLSLMDNFKNTFGGEILLFGVSYGTFLSERIIKISQVRYPGLISAVALDGICGDKFCSFKTSDEVAEKTAMSFFDACAKDSTCGAKLGGQKEEILKKLTQLYATQNMCTNLFGGVRNVMRSFLVSALQDNTMRLLIPPLIYRGLRCNLIDFFSINYMIRNVVSAQASENAGHVGYPTSLPININIGVSELQGRFTKDAEAKDYASSCVMCSGAASLYSTVVGAGWIPYNQSDYQNKVLATDLPLLLMNGDLDPQTGIDNAESYHQLIKDTCPNTKFVRFPNAVHFVVGRSPLAKDISVNCGATILADFFKSKSVANLNTDCTNNLQGVDFGGNAYTYNNVAVDMYEGLGINKTQYTIFVVVVTLICGLAALICLCCVASCCFLCRRNSRKQAPTMVELETHLITQEGSSTKYTKFK
ncbi:hypothetical protein AKO1_008291 [Acrasis kona]|uniref:Uncharacterized protein n=1 Tax=Acrasis kona TaxID=1008807 RepID=A0AAW2YPH2_9EUKA